MIHYYSKQRKLVRHVYSVTASANFETLYPPGHLQSPLSSSSNFNAVSGSYVYNNPSDPRRVFINVPHYGKIVDISVWVEFIHDYRNLGPPPGNVARGLLGVTLALRSPNTNFFSGHALQNNKAFAGKDVSDKNTLSNNNLDPAPLFDIYKNSYILWDGDSMGSKGKRLPGTADRGSLTFDLDCDMRTIFTDSSPYLNPRNLDLLYPNATDSDPGASTGAQVGSSDNDSQALTANTPTQIFYEKEGYPLSSLGAAFGANVPWMYDNRIPTVAITGSTFFTGSQGKRIVSPSGTVASGSEGLGMSPPKGWLSGPGQIAGPGEFPTTGSQIGRPTMQPFYPFLSDIVVEKAYDDPRRIDIANTKASGTFVPVGNRFPGFRPGLKGTEIHGRWEFLMGTFVNNGVLQENHGIWFRQVRLEVLVDEGEDGAFTSQSRMRYNVPGYVPSKTGKRLLHIFSGTAFWDVGIDYMYEVSPPAYGRTAGITDDIGTSTDSFSVFSRITGSLSGNLSPSQFTNLQRGFLKNEFGTPYIPISSGSGVSPSFDPFDSNDSAKSRFLLNSAVNPKLGIEQASNLKSVLNRTDFFESTAKATSRIFASLDSLFDF